MNAVPLRTYLLREQSLIPAVVNFLLNAGIAWLVFPQSSVPMWGFGGLVQDVVITCLLLPSLLCLIDTPLVWNDVRTGRVQPAEGTSGGPFGWLPGSLRLRCVTLGLLGLVVVAPLAVAVLWAIGPDSVSRLAVILGKGVGTAVAAGLLAPFVALRAMSDPKAKRTLERSGSAV